MQRATTKTTGHAVLYLWKERHARNIPGQPADETALLDFIAHEQYAMALNVLVQQYQDAIVTYCYASLFDPHLAQEVAQEIFLAACEGLSRFRGDSSVKTWLYSIASKKCLEVGRTLARRESLIRDNKSRIASTAHGEPPRLPEDLLAEEHRRQRVQQALRRLRVYDRELLILRYLQDLTYADIARILQVSRRTVERHLPRAEAKFLKAYEKVDPS
jgi:RNA polymerase sigma-70 factor, ECF subfamily